MSEVRTNGELSEVVEAQEMSAKGTVLFSSFGSSVEDAKSAYNAVTGSGYLHDGMLDIPLKVANVILERGERVNRETGEMVACINSYIVTDDGSSYFTQSSGIARGLASISQLVPDFKDADGDPLTIIIRARRMNNGNILKVVEWV